VSAILSVFSVIYLSGVKIAKIEVKVDTMWSFLMRRAIAEVVFKGLADMNSPIVIRKEAKALFRGLTEDLRSFYRGLGKELTDVDLIMLLEQQFGDRILKEVCIPNGLLMGACMIIALEIAKEEGRRG
jgi:hypothetical protein